MQTIDMFRDLIQELDATEIPVKYIAAACHTDEDGNENVVTGDDLDNLMDRSHPYERVMDVQLLLDLRVIAIDVGLEVRELFDRVLDRLAVE
jgi:predicted regulator of amino acid metabolism with ACT domain